MPSNLIKAKPEKKREIEISLVDEGYVSNESDEKKKQQ